MYFDEGKVENRCSPLNYTYVYASQFCDIPQSVDRDKVFERNRLYFDISLTRNTRCKGADELFRYGFSEAVSRRRNKEIQSVRKSTGHSSSYEITGNDTTPSKKKLKSEKKTKKNSITFKSTLVR